MGSSKPTTTPRDLHEAFHAVLRDMREHPERPDAYYVAQLIDHTVGFDDAPWPATSDPLLEQIEALRVWRHQADNTCLNRDEVIAIVREGGGE